VPTLLAAAVWRWNAFALPWLLLGISLVALAVIIFARQRASRVAMLFCVMIALVAGWFLAFSAMFLARDARAAELLARFALFCVALLPAAIYDFTVTTLRLSRQRLVTVVWAAAALFSLLALASNLLLDGVRSFAWGFYPRAGSLIAPFLVFFIAVIAAHVFDFIRELSLTEDPTRRARLGRMLVSFLVVYLAGIDFLPMFGIAIRPIGYVPVLGFIVVAWSTIRRHRLQHITATRATREIVNTMADALFVIDADGNIRVLNDAVYTLFGYRDADLLGRSIDRLEQTEGDRTITRTLRDLARRDPIRDQERVFRHRDGTGINVSVSISPVREDDVQRGAVVIARDIRERKRAEEELRLFAGRLEQSNRELEDFAYVASHDLQEPLRKIQAFGDLLKTKHGADLPAQARDYVDRMQSAAGRMQGLINDLLAFSRVTTKAHPFATVNLDAVARDIVHDLEIRLHETGGHVDVGPLPSIEADALQIRQLLQNLVGNALKFNRPDVPPVVTIRAQTEGDWCSIMVQDNGIGFEPRYAERIFGLFERLHGRGRYEGTGIGLAICRKIAERHGGTIRAEGRPGDGATFTVTLPVRQHTIHDHDSREREADHHPPR
jgi:PAS domain S-box-containing protein